MRRPEEAAPGEVPQMRLMADSQFQVACPMLWEWLTDDTWEGGGVRQTATLLVFVEAGRWKGCLNDRDSGRSCFLSAETPEDLLRAFEAGLDASSLEWRAKASRTPSTTGGRK